MWTRATQALILFGLIGFGAAGVAQTAPSNGGASPAQVGAQPIAGAAANAERSGSGAPLGDLSTFRAITVDTGRRVAAASRETAYSTRGGQLRSYRHCPLVSHSRWRGPSASRTRSS